MNTFEVDGVTFEQRHLEVDAACEGLELLAQILGPAVEGLTDQNVDLGATLASALSRSTKLAPLMRLFAGVCKVSRTPGGEYQTGGNMVELKPFAKDVFRGRLDLLMAFLVKCATFEYGRFLDGGGALAGLMAPATE